MSKYPEGCAIGQIESTPKSGWKWIDGLSTFMHSGLWSKHQEAVEICLKCKICGPKIVSGTTKDGLHWTEVTPSSVK